ncbi:MAG: FAD-binding protein [Ketobacter sp.]|nr:FAD-binding protein [Ketobacter sp.]
MTTQIQPQPLAPSLLDALNILLGQRLCTHHTVLLQHGHGESHHQPAPPAAIAYVNSADELTEIAQLCHQHRTPMTAFGAGTSVEGQLQCVAGGLCIDFSQMNRIIEVNEADLNCAVEPGVTREQLNLHLRDKGLFFPVDPGANATLGGMVATGASGTTTVRYGGMKHNVLSLNAVLANGEPIVTGTAARKSSAGYNLTELIIGSEGTLALITEIRLKLYGIPEHVLAARVQFPSVHQAVSSVMDMMQHGLPVARLELLDEFALKAVNQYCGSQYPQQPTLFIEFHGSSTSTQEHAQQAQYICQEYGGSDFAWASTEADKKRMWHARHNAYYAALAQVPNGQGWVTDVCVPISHLAQCIEDTRQDLSDQGLNIPIVGHVGDGNFHLLFSIPPDNHTLLRQALDINQRLIQRALAAGGTCTGEHGIGLGKKNYLQQEKGESTITIMKGIKQTFDPLNLLNPGKIF